MNRRDFIKLVGVGLVLGGTGVSFGDIPRFYTLEEALRKFAGLSKKKLVKSNKVKVIAPNLAEDGANVKVEVLANLDPKKVEALYIFSDDNPNPFILEFKVSPYIPKLYVKTRIKMAKTSYVRGIVKLKNGKGLYNLKKVEVVAGGCG